MISTFSVRPLEFLVFFLSGFSATSQRLLNGFMSEQAQCFYEFGEYRIATGERLLKRGGEVVPLPPKAIELLALLASNGHVMSKEEFIAHVWTDSFVEEANLSHNVFLLRKALTNGTSGAKFIETIPRRRYSFAANVTQAPELPPAPISHERTISQIIVEEEIEN